MPTTILTNWTVYYSDDAPAGTSGYKQIRWTGAGTPQAETNTVNELYSAVADLFSIAAQNNANDTIPILAVTPTVYNIGSFDQRDLEPWFIDPDSVQHLTGGSLQTVNWTRVVNADANLGSPGILKVPYTGGTPFVASDIGRAIANGTATGTLLWYSASAGEAWIRPTSCVSTHNWAGPAGTIAVTGGTGSVTQNGAALNGERLWSNIYSIGTIEDNTNLVVYQNFSPITSFWAAGHIDRLFLVNDGFASGLIDFGYLTVFARQYTKYFDHFLADVSGGGRNPIPLSTDDDINNTTGYRTFIGTGRSGTFNVGNYIYVGASWAAATKKGVLTAVATDTLTYYLVGDYTDFAASDAVVEYVPSTGTNDATITAGAPANAGPLTSPSSSVTIVFGGADYDLGNGNGSKPYSVTIDCGGATVLELYERLKYLTRNGQTTDIDTGANQSIIGQQYTSIGDLYLPYDTGSIDNPFDETAGGGGNGGEVISATSFTSKLTSKHDQGTSEGFIVVRNTRGTTPVDNATLTGGTSSNTALVDTNSGADPVTAIAAYKTAPFGTFAGGIFFGARGVYITNMAGASANSYTLIDSEGTTQAPPASIAITVNGVVSGDRVSVFRAVDGNTSGSINKTYMVSDNTANVAGDTTFVVDAIPSDTPSSGQIRVVNNPNPTEHRFRFVSWTGSTFTLVTTGIPTGTIEAIGDVTGRSFRADSANLANILPGDLVRNTSDGTPGSWALVTSVTLISGTIYEVVHSALQGGTENDWDVGDGYSFNNLPLDYTTADTAYVPYIDQTATGTSVSASVIYSADRNISTQVRRKGIIPFSVNNIVLDSDGYTATAVRTTDSIVT